ncbi:MAG: hypothetical protein H0X38_13125 [Planctomycetes bacterium]|nr:hypothetical protein [Planctomycetota bacterium]
MPMIRPTLAAILVLAAPWALALDAPVARPPAWANGPSSAADFFPIAVWLQSPANAAAYRAAGVNLYIGLWDGPTEVQLAELAAAHMPVMCAQNAVGLAHLADRTIVGWTQVDEPDNAQELKGGGYGPPILPAEIARLYADMKAKDATRPVFLNLGQGTSFTAYIGRGVRTGHDEDYIAYAAGGDVLAFDIYPVNAAEPAVGSRLEFVPKGVTRLRAAGGGRTPVWCWIETTRIGKDAPAKPTPAQVRSEVWLALIHGASGIGYFCHSWNPTFDEAGPLHDPAMLAGLTAINQQVRDLAPALNSPLTLAGASVVAADPAVPVALLAKRVGSESYLFAGALRMGTTMATFIVPEGASVEVLGEGRTIPISGHAFSDRFEGYGVHLYRVVGKL